LTGVAGNRWEAMLSRELKARQKFECFDEADWRRQCNKSRVTSSNHDTVLSLDWPHYCLGATEGCGGPQGWCYTFHGYIASPAHARRVAFVDALASLQPIIFAECVASEVSAAVKLQKIPYPNARYSGSGEMALHHLPALAELINKGVHMWGFTRRLEMAEKLREMGASVIVSCDASSDLEFINSAHRAGFPLAYSSINIEDHPPKGTVVTFPVHRGRFVSEVTAAPNLCPKVVEQFMQGTRKKAYCQNLCRRCHLLK
jgi:hypothetical protein